MTWRANRLIVKAVINFLRSILTAPATSTNGESGTGGTTGETVSDAGGGTEAAATSEGIPVAREAAGDAAGNTVVIIDVSRAGDGPAARGAAGEAAFACGMAAEAASGEGGSDAGHGTDSDDASPGGESLSIRRGSIPGETSRVDAASKMAPVSRSETLRS